jgi:hypothetical protein
MQPGLPENVSRIPSHHAPQSTTEAAVLAFYFTKAFDDEKWSIRWYAPLRGHELVRRRDLLPGQPDHPRADEAYYKLQLGPLMQLELPIHSLRWRRITFIETTWDRFTAAEEINDLYASGADGLFVTLKDEGFWPELEFEIREGDATYTVDLAIPCHEGTVAIALGNCLAPSDALRDPDLETVQREPWGGWAEKSPRISRAGAPVRIRHTGLDPVKQGCDKQ